VPSNQLRKKIKHHCIQRSSRCVANIPIVHWGKNTIGDFQFTDFFGKPINLTVQLFGLPITFVVDHVIWGGCPTRRRSKSVEKKNRNRGQPRKEKFEEKRVSSMVTVVWTSLGPLPRWVPGPTTRWAPGTTRLALHGI
jgi:hypothetical protein